jgi:UDP-N-acetylmuramate--alanine ligase
MMTRIGIFFGGRSREREISFAGGRTVYDNLDKTLFRAVPIFVDSFGNFILLDWQYIYKGSIRDFYPPVAALPISAHQFQIYAESLGALTPAQQDELARSIGTLLHPHQLKQHIDFAFLALHGAYGEDGTIQGLLQYMDIPYTASGIFPSAFGMDKGVQRKLMRAAQFNVPSFILVNRHNWLRDTPQLNKQLFAYLKDTVGLPMVIKPANQGSSIGARILADDDFDKFTQAVNHAFFVQEITAQFWTNLNTEHRIQWLRDLVDIRSGLGLPVLVQHQQKTQVIYHPEQLLQYLNTYFEQNTAPLLLQATDNEHEVVIEGFLSGKEFSCIVLRNEQGKAVALPPTEIRKGKELFDYRSKYLAGLSSKITPIDLPIEEINSIRKECQRLFDYFKFHTYARIDGFIDETGTIFLNDPNTTSGMLPSSFFFHQAAEIGLNPSQFLTYIIRSSIKERYQTTTNSHHLATLLAHLDAQIEQLHLQTDHKKRVGVVLGGYSTERHISVESGRNIYEKLASSEQYAPIPVFLTGNDQHYHFYEIPINILLKDNADDIKEKIEHFSTHPVIEQIRGEFADVMAKYCSPDVVLAPRELNFQTLKERVDVAFIALHGRPGEDGNLQEHFDLFDIPYNGSSANASQITIDKFATNQTLAQHGVKVAKQMLVYKRSWQANQRQLVERIEQQFTYPLIAKPSDDGCSSAVKKIDDWGELLAYMNLIFRAEADPHSLEDAVRELGLKPKEEFPQKEFFLIEELIHKGDAAHFLEVTGGLLTHHQPDGTVRYEVFEPSETLASGEVLSLEEKFLAGEGQNLTPARYNPDAQKQQTVSHSVRAELLRVAQILNIEGYARIDAFVKIYESGEIDTYIIEVNSLPGMTPATCIFHQCAINNYTPYQFIDQILRYGIEKKAK